ncbi:MAG: CoA transferase [Dehalococcoidia bacterium]|nr:CoA transferase [Dehalococcoidia bacterium]
MRILELSDALGAAAYCGKLFRRWGHEVIRVESTGVAREDAAAEIYLNGGKLRAACDFDLATDRAELDRIAATADLLVTDRSVADIERFGLLAVGAGEGPRARVALTPFGLTGPYAHAPATEATLLALGGYTNLIGDPHREPLTFVGRYASYQQGTMGFIAGVATTLAAAAEPVTVDLSALETLASLHQSTYSKWLETGQARGRSGNRMDGAANSLLRVKDGWAGVSFQQQFWFSFATMIGRLDIAEGHPLSTPAGRLKHYEELVEVVEGAFRDRTMQDLFDEAQGQWRIPIGKLLGIREALDDPHLLEREFWRPLEEPLADHEDLRVPGSSFRVIGEPLPAEHAPVDAVPIASLTPTLPAAKPARGAAKRDATKPLEGVRVLDLSRVWAGPTTARILGDLGADVIKIEAPTNRGPREVAQGTRGYLITDRNRGMPWNAQSVFNQLQRNRRGVCVDLKSEDGKALFLDLVRESDVVIENFSARAMGRLGLGYDVMREVNPRIIYVPMPAFGRSGPYRDYVGLGTSVEPLASIPSILGYEGGDARTAAIAIPDPMAGTTAAAAVMVGLLRRDATGEGCEFDFSQQETSIGFIGEYFIQAQLDGTEPVRAGNSHPRYAPYGLYPCAGEDEWIAIGARDDSEWTALAHLADGGWAEDARFTTNEARLANRGALDALIAAWTAPQEKLLLTERLMTAGVPAGGVLKGPELVADPQLAARGYFANLEHPVTGPQRFDGAPFVFNGQRGYEWWQPTPMLGEHNRDVLSSVLGLDGARIDALEAAGVLRDAPPE